MQLLRCNRAETVIRMVTPVLLFVLIIMAKDAFGQNYGEAIYANNRQAVVTIVAFDASGNSKSLGTGFITSSNGKIVTNYHVIEKANSLMIKLLTGAMFPVEGYLALSSKKDFAVLKVNGKELPTVKLGALESVKVGQGVFALGSPLGMEQTFTNGMVSSIRDGSEINESQIPKIIQHTAPISSGNSGSPLFNSQGYVIGINTLILKGGQNLNFAIPIDYVKPHLAKTGVTPFPIEKRNNPNIVSETKTNFFNRRSPSELMVKISAGRFLMGSNDGLDNEKPVHTVYVDAFYIDIYEVTNAQYKKFVEATGHSEPKGYGFVDGEVKDGFEPWNSPYFNGDNQPVVCVSWHDAMAYAQWAGKHLPTEAEWEYAARGGLAGKKYPWGDTLTHDNANYSGTGGRDKWKYTAPVGSFPANNYGLYDMAGNIYEWCLDEYQADFYSKSPRTNPIAGAANLDEIINNFTDLTVRRVLRGGSWGYFNYDVRVANRGRFLPGNWDATFGFRCVSAR